MGSPQEEATQLKNKGNEAFKNQDWPAALDFYTKAIELWDKEPSFYTNRAQVGRPSALHKARN
jgi:serine/threonine-protein phosphatase 5